MLRPARRTDVPMHVTGLQSEPVHGRQMPDRIALLAVQHQLGFRGRAGGEIEQLRVGCQGRTVGHELVRPLVSLFELLPAGNCATDGDARVVAGQAAELVGVRMADHHMPHLAAVEAVAQVIGGEQRGGRRQHRAELDRRQHRIPQRDLVAEHHQDAIATPDALRTQPVGDLVRTLRHFGERHLLFRAVFVDHPQRRTVVACSHHIEIIQRPVEFRKLRPLKIPVRRFVVGAVSQKKIARLHEGRIRHVGSSLVDESSKTADRRRNARQDDGSGHRLSPHWVAGSGPERLFLTGAADASPPADLRFPFPGQFLLAVAVQYCKGLAGRQGRAGHCSGRSVTLRMPPREEVRRQREFHIDLHQRKRLPQQPFLRCRAESTQFLRRRSARPSKPIPISARLAGSGTRMMKKPAPPPYGESLTIPVSEWGPFARI